MLPVFLYFPDTISYFFLLWKSPRPKKHYQKNLEREIKEASRMALSAKSEEEKIESLTRLKGVSIPVASSILTIIDPKKYGIIDIRVWQTLYLYNEISTKPSGQGFTVKDWGNYLSILRRYASQLNVNVRDIERTLLFHHREIQEGNLYK